MQFDKRYKPPCSARAADGVLRGSLVGLAWGLYLPSPVSFSIGRRLDNTIDSSSKTGEQASVNTPTESKSAPKPSYELISKSKKSPEFNIFTGWKFKPGSFFRIEPAYTSRKELLRTGKQHLRDFAPTARNMGFSTLIFAAIFGTFSGTTCASEAITGYKDDGHPANIFLGGCAAGSLLSLGIRKPGLEIMLLNSIGTGVLTALITVLMS